MTRPWLEVGGQAAYHRLCASIVALARAGLARVAARDGDPLAGDGPPAGQFAGRVAELQTTWAAAEAQVPGGGPLGRLSRLLRSSQSFVETVLFALIAAPALDRGVARACAALEPGGLTAGLVLELASTVDTHRFALAAALHPDAALRRTGLVGAGVTEADAEAVIGSSTRLAVAPTALAVLRSEPIPLPAGVHELWPVPQAGPAAAALTALAVPFLGPGRVTALIAGDAPTAAAIAVARLLAAVDGRALWHLTTSDRSEPAWAALIRDATLANAVAVVHAPAGRAWLSRAAAACDRAMGAIVCVLPSEPVADDAAVAVELVGVAERARRAEVRAAVDDPAVDALVAAIAG